MRSRSVHSPVACSILMLGSSKCFHGKNLAHLILSLFMCFVCLTLRLFSLVKLSASFRYCSLVLAAFRYCSLVLAVMKAQFKKCFSLRLSFLFRFPHQQVLFIDWSKFPFLQFRAYDAILLNLGTLVEYC